MTTSFTVQLSAKEMSATQLFQQLVKQSTNCLIFYQSEGEGEHGDYFRSCQEEEVLPTLTELFPVDQWEHIVFQVTGKDTYHFGAWNKYGSFEGDIHHVSDEVVQELRAANPSVHLLDEGVVEGFYPPWF